MAPVLRFPRKQMRQSYTRLSSSKIQHVLMKLRRCLPMSEKGHRDLFARIISIISIIGSLIALWYSVLAPAELKASMSAPMFLWRSGLETPVSGTEQAKPILLIKSTCEFSNNGAKFEEISYLALRFESDDGTRWVFAPYWLVDDAKFVADGFAKWTWIKEPIPSSSRGNRASGILTCFSLSPAWRISRMLP